jgi:hypothetical protein
MLNRLVGWEESATWPSLALASCVTTRLYAFQLEQMRSEIEAVLIRHLNRGGRISLFVPLSIEIIVTKISRRVDDSLRTLDT